MILETECGNMTSLKYKDPVKAKETLVKAITEGSIEISKAEKKERQEKAPALFDLTSLQREANRRLGYTAQQTLDYTQALYEKKLVSYPRTDSRFLTEDMESTLPGLIDKAAKVSGCSATEKVNLRSVINGKKVTDHHAIIPTASVDKEDLRELPPGERAVLKLIATRLLEAVSSPCVYVESILEGVCAGEPFSAKGKTVTDYGWRSVAKACDEKRADDENETGSISGNIPDSGKISISNGGIKAGKTTAPKCFTEDTLLSAMEKAGSSETPDEAERKGLGTPATRAGIIEKLAVPVSSKGGETRKQNISHRQLRERC